MLGKRVNVRRGIGWASLTELGQCEAEAKDCTTTRPYHSVQTLAGGGGMASGHSVSPTELFLVVSVGNTAI